jgi:hypothetical protein
VITNKLTSYGAAHREVLRSGEHHQSKYRECDCTDGLPPIAAPEIEDSRESPERTVKSHRYAVAHKFGVPIEFAEVVEHIECDNWRQQVRADNGATGRGTTHDMAPVICRHPSPLVPSTTASADACVDITDRSLNRTEPVRYPRHRRPTARPLGQNGQPGRTDHR